MSGTAGDRLAVIVPVKPLERAKSRLAAALGDSARRTLVPAMLDDVLAAVRAAHDGPLLLVSTDRRYDEAAARYDARRVPDGSPGYNGAVGAALRLDEVVATGAALILPADLPQLLPDAVRTLAQALEEAPVVLVPSADAGTSALGMRPPDAMPLAFGPDSADAHRRLAGEAGLALAEPPLPAIAIDIDTLDDLRSVAAHAGPATTAALQRLGGSDGGLASIRADAGDRSD
ncbi:MAG: 2-phospho-L-lactate guanylyltransferase [Dehalococcoidia bacterium]|nr:2-phospho-L-lactate guanylyltransferase [Dehalococcoidia bacterium]